nr:unnamed protein product [Callosobruchus analis]
MEKCRSEERLNGKWGSFGDVLDIRNGEGTPTCIGAALTFVDLINNVEWLAEHFLEDTAETRGGALNSRQKMQIFLDFKFKLERMTGFIKQHVPEFNISATDGDEVAPSSYQ